MGFFSKLFNEDNDQPEVKISITSSTDDVPERKKVTFSDNDPDLMDDINSHDTAAPNKSLPFGDTCPYCGVIFDKPVKRKKTCSDCGKTMYVRTTQELYPSSTLTEEQLNHAEFYMTMKNVIFVTMDDYKKVESMLKKKWNMAKINTYDVLWSLSMTDSLYQRHIDKTYDRKRVMTEVLNRHTWVGIAAATYQANRGHDPSGYLEGAHNSQIQQAKLDDYIKGLTVKSYSCCDACMKFDDKTFSIDFLEKTPVLPVKTCTRPFSDKSKFTFCTCSYQSYYEWE